MNKLPVCPIDQLPPGKRRIVQASEKISIGVFNVEGRFYALRNICPHRKAPLCKGQITGQVTSDGPGDAQMQGPQQIIRCPWHGWEFDITTGQSVFNPHKVRVKTYPVTVEWPGNCAPKNDDPALDTYPVTIENGIVTVLLKPNAASTPAD
jgi:nitrite reductase/ring-hydroxylating ferredoxin subunit